jgi:hypothetical protein
MFVYSSTVYRAVATGVYELTRRCSACNQASEGRVNALSEGEAESAYGLTNKQGIANDRASRGLPIIAQATIDLAACPHCGAREDWVFRPLRRGVLSAVVLTTAASLVPLLIALVSMLIGAAVAIDERGGILDALAPVGVGIAFGVLWYFLTRSTYRKRLQKDLDLADAKLVWLVPGAPSAEPEPPPPVVAAPAASNGWPFA